MAFRNTYFSLAAFDPRPALDRRRNPFRHQETVDVRGKPLVVHWTRRAHTRLEARSTPLWIELQWYFSCVVQKRFHFHDVAPDADDDWVAVGDRLKIRVRAIESAICDPTTFAREHPQRRTLNASAALRMVPHHFELDVRKDQWVGQMRFDAR